MKDSDSTVWLCYTTLKVKLQNIALTFDHLLEPRVPFGTAHVCHLDVLNFRPILKIYALKLNLKIHKAFEVACKIHSFAYRNVTLQLDLCQGITQDESVFIKPTRSILQNDVSKTSCKLLKVIRKALVGLASVSIIYSTLLLSVTTLLIAFKCNLSFCLMSHRIDTCTRSKWQEAQSVQFVHETTHKLNVLH